MVRYSNEAVFCPEAKNPLRSRGRAGCHYLISLSVCVCVCDIEFVLFTDCESCTRPIFTNLVSMQAGEYGLTRGTWFFARRLEVVAVAGLLWLSRCVFGEADFFSISTTMSQPMAARDPDSSQRRLGEGAPTVSQSAHRELAPTYPHQVYRLVRSHVRNVASSVS